ncbi:polyphosphate kinase 1 [Candidatus Sumerlaeota bacterium]|nr:polyphosphate kinase 1 [Candidatus Sumerlaeota bacterium]
MSSSRTQRAKTASLTRPQFLIDREISWLAFNDRVVEEAEDETTPLLERLKFLGIAQSNLDEFFMIRVAGIQDQISSGLRMPNAAGFTPEQHYEKVHQQARRQVKRMYDCYRQMLLPALQKKSIFVRSMDDLTPKQRKFARDFFDRQVYPVLTPLAVDSAHPFPHLRNLSLNLAVRLTAPRGYHAEGTLFAVVQVPAVLPRAVKLPSREEGMDEFVLLECMIAKEIKLLFPGMRVLEVCAFRITRDGDLAYDEEEAEDLLKTVEAELRSRERGNAVRMGVESTGSAELIAFLMEAIELQPIQVYLLDGPINLSEVAQIAGSLDRPELKTTGFTPSLREPLKSEKSIFAAIAREDVLAHHPYESFSSVVDFISQAAEDPSVLAIKQTLYRTSADSVIVKKLIEAAEKGKQVAALMELKARFDEQRNIAWAKQMERAGVHVVYGLVGLKTHAKLCLVVRKEKDGIRRYLHMGTGNYNPITARIYTDLSLFTCDPDLCDDASEIFNFLTGYSRMPELRKVSIAPINMRQKILEMIDGEAAKARRKKPGRIRAKMNSLVDTQIIEHLYKASIAGVQVDLIVRGICCLRPGMPGVSENIRVSSIVDRFLEHHRIFIFGEGEDERVFLASSDWMPRNLDRRVETLFPVQAPLLKRRIVDEIFSTHLADNVKRRALQSDGSYRRIPRGNAPALRSQEELLAKERKLEEMENSATESNEAPRITAADNNASAAEHPFRPPKPAARTAKIPDRGGVIDLPNLLSIQKPRAEELLRDNPSTGEDESIVPVS